MRMIVLFEAPLTQRTPQKRKTVFSMGITVLIAANESFALSPCAKKFFFASRPKVGLEISIFCRLLFSCESDESSESSALRCVRTIQNKYTNNWIKELIYWLLLYII